MNMNFIRKLPIPLELKTEMPVSTALAAVKAERDEEIRRIFTGKSDKLLLIIGPCSADREEPVMEYLRRLRRISDEVSEKIFVLPRLYTCKPRSAGDGYMGFIHQPNPNEAPDIFRGVAAVREFHLRALAETGFSCADELLYTENHRYLSDLLSYVAVGARSVEDQQHRLTASGLDIPVGMKNPTGGDPAAMLNAVHAAQSPHRFIYRGWEVESAGNPLAHCVLRGYTERDGSCRGNYRYDDLLKIAELYEERDLENPSIIVDTNHANSGKNCFLQPEIALDVIESRRDPALRRLVKGIMTESYLVDGAQDESGGVFGCSITDPCLGWEKTERLIYDIAERL